MLLKEVIFLSQREEIIAIAAKEIGYKEYQNNNNKYGVWYGMNNQPWCAMFVSWCADQVGALGNNNKSGIIPRTAWVPDYQTYYSAKGLYKPKGSYTPKCGDIIIYGSNSHVGLVEQVSNGKVITIEGNTSANGNSSNGDGVYRRTRSLTDSWIKGYCVPEYEEEQMEIKTVGVKNLDNGKMIEVEAINVAGSNYIKLRDVEKLFPVTIDWDGKNPTIELNYKQ